MFIEQDVDAPIGNRLDKFWASFGQETASLPLTMLESGHKILTGEFDNYGTVYRGVVKPEVARPPQAEVEAYVRQVGAKLRVYAVLRNNSNTTLSASANQAALTALVFEDKAVGVTGRIIRAAPWLNLTAPLAAGGTMTATIDTGNLAGVNWSALHTVVAADWVPGGGPAFDMLQAAVARPVGLTASPSAIPVGVDSGAPADRTVPVALSGPYTLSWTASADVPWLVATPDAAPIATRPSLTVSAGLLAAGSQEGHVTFFATSPDGMAFTDAVTVNAVAGPRRLRAVAPPVVAGSPVALPVVISALGDERAVSFTLAFDPAVVWAPSVAAGAAAAEAAIEVDDAEAASGRIGVTLTLPAGQTCPAGDDELAVVTFATAAAAEGSSTVVGFSDQPVPTAIADGFATPLTAAWEDASLAFPTQGAVRAVRRRVQRPGA